MRLSRLHKSRDEQKRGVEYSHDGVVEALVAGGRHPPFEWEDKAEDLDEVERGNEDILVGSTDELHCLLGIESHVFVYGVVGYV